MNNSGNYEGDENLNPLNQAFFEPGPENEGLEEGEMLFSNQDPNETMVSPPAIELDSSKSDDEGNISYPAFGGRRKSRKSRKTKSRKATRKAKSKSRKTKVRKVKKTRRIRKSRRSNRRSNH